MAIRLQQMHPTLVHLPITLLPLPLGADLIGRVSGNQPSSASGARLAGVDVVAYTAYLGGKLVYNVGVGVGVEPAKDVYWTDAPKYAKQHADEEVAGINRSRGA